MAETLKGIQGNQGQAEKDGTAGRNVVRSTIKWWTLWINTSVGFFTIVIPLALASYFLCGDFFFQGKSSSGRQSFAPERRNTAPATYTPPSVPQTRQSEWKEFIIPPNTEEPFVVPPIPPGWLFETEFDSIEDRDRVEHIGVTKKTGGDSYSYLRTGKARLRSKDDKPIKGTWRIVPKPSP